MIRKRITLIYILLLWFVGSHAQYVQADFAQHLSDNRYYQEIIDLTDGMSFQISGAKADSLNFYRGWAFFNLQRVPEGIVSFRKIPAHSKLFNRFMFLSAWSSVYLGHHDDARHDLSLIVSPDKIEKELLAIQYSGLHLLNLKADSALLLLNTMSNQASVYDDQIDLLKTYSLETLNFKPKSMAIAGLLSAVIPGTGKVYAGEKGAGIGSLLLLAGMGGMAVENILKSGITSWNSIMFTGLFSLFYLGNVYGSIISIKTYRERFYESKEQAIVATILIPLRDYYR
ncbi:MAG: hypothetical protein HN686_10970 [Bacteroidetes bacterium]|nr:hypothetical protein [Bacteroidota bacterium]MBT7464498.1 hypothetical protein [Bacteroidota bacterium]